MNKQADCDLCIKRGKTWEGSDPVCSFPNGGRFDPDGWNCATVNLIRDIVHEGGYGHPLSDYRYCDDMKYATVYINELESVEGMALWVAWYKNRGGTDAMWILDSENPPRRPNEKECLDIYKYADWVQKI